ncbi:hypothetical protein PT974_00006 [Cladobotryum mycophilum]|uniref:HIT domain-containing protein n=1 Tax=Cladobotryum mycophilum TaxID=491253 RepID=A0ABR0T109_9HYPO
MQTIKRIVHYLSNLEWTERSQEICVFCDRNNFASIVYENGQIIVVDNRRRAGQMHWLIMPKLHVVRDIENLNTTHLDLCETQQHQPHIPPNALN